MPMEFLERLPVPNLRVYTAISFTILSCSIYYATRIIKDPAWRTNHTHVDVGVPSGNDVDPIDPRSLGTHLKELLECMVVEPVCVWVCLFEINQCKYVQNILIHGLRAHFICSISLLFIEFFAFFFNFLASKSFEMYAWKLYER